MEEVKSLKLTDKQAFILNLLSNYASGATCYQLIKDYTNELHDKNIDTTKINSVNATLASLATKGLVTKSPIAYNGKMLTCYKLK